MIYIFNKVLSDSKKIVYSLTALYGINQYQSKQVCKQIGINPTINTNQLKSNHVNRLIKYIKKNVPIEHVFKKKKKDHFHVLMKIKLVRAIRHRQGLPVHGQRTHTNAKTARGVSNRKKIVKKNKNKK